MGKSSKDELKAFGFCEGLRVSVDSSGNLDEERLTDDVKSKKPVVYVALRDDQRVLKVGISKNGLWSRWRDILKLMREVNNPDWRRENEKDDREKLLQLTIGHSFTVWYKDAHMIKVPYDSSKGLYPAHGAEEIFLDAHFEPDFGQRLDRPPRKP